MCSLKCVIWWVSPQTFPFGRRLADKAPRGRETYGGCCLFPLGCAQPRLHQEGPQGSGWLPAFLWGHLCVARHCLARCKPACGACCAGHILALPRVGSWLRVLELVKVLKVASGHRDSCYRHSHLECDCSGAGDFGSISLVGSCGKLELKARFCRSGHSLCASGLGFISSLAEWLFSMMAFVNRLMTFCANHVLHLQLLHFTALAGKECVMFVFPISWKEFSDLLFKKNSCKRILL